jgi:hypothetical protein
MSIMHIQARQMTSSFSLTRNVSGFFRRHLAQPFQHGTMALVIAV